MISLESCELRLITSDDFSVPQSAMSQPIDSATASSLTAFVLMNTRSTFLPGFGDAETFHGVFDKIGFGVADTLRDVARFRDEFAGFGFVDGVGPACLMQLDSHLSQCVISPLSCDRRKLSRMLGISNGFFIVSLFLWYRREAKNTWRFCARWRSDQSDMALNPGVEGSARRLQKRKFGNSQWASCHCEALLWSSVAIVSERRASRLWCSAFRTSSNRIPCAAR